MPCAPCQSARWRRLAGLLGLLGVLTACASLPPQAPRPSSHAFAATADTRLGRAVLALSGDAPDNNGFTPLAVGGDALAARLNLIDQADRSLDLQYYIWKPDASGLLLLGRLEEAAARGVRVRLLLDDIGNGLPDNRLLELDARANFEVRLFNPAPLRLSRTLNALLDFTRLNRRMHNKSMIADNQVVILGGRNIGDEYFAARGKADFGDLDVMGSGPIVREASATFDAYWNSPHAWSATELIEARGANSPEVLIPPSGAGPAEDWNEATLLLSPPGGRASFFEARASLLADDPDKILRSPRDHSGHLWPQLLPVVERTREELLLISPYFVPGETGMRFLRELRARGVRITVLTNSLAATDMSVVHSGYARYRRALLEAGVALWEVRPEGPNENPPGWGDGGNQGLPLIGKSLRSSLHAKTFVFDRRELFIGSLNLDPRSTALNTESGVLIGNAEFAARMNSNVHRLLPASAWRLSLENGELRWHELQGDGHWLSFDTEPHTTALRRLWVKLLAYLPIEEQL